MNIHLEINANIIDKMKHYNITNDVMCSVLFILIGLYEGKIELLDKLDDKTKQRKVLLLYRMLQRLDLIEYADEEELSLFTLTQEGVSLVEFVKKEFSNVTHESLTTETVVKELNENSVETWIEDWINLFPPRKNGRTYRSHPKEVLPRMEEFVKKHGYSKEVIFNATKAYLKEQEEENDHRFAIESHYFIKKGKGEDANSKLSAVCYEYVTKPQEENDNRFRDVI